MITQGRKRMFTVAFEGPDGAGKTTIIQSLEKMPELRAKRIYMGIMLESSNIMLPTSRLILALRRARLNRSEGFDQSLYKSKNRLQKALQRAGSALLLINLIMEEWYRQIVTWYYLKCNYLVLFDRHFYYQYQAYQVASLNPPRDLGTRLQAFLLDHFYPKPDLVIYLDAPAEVLYARKGERTVEILERWRQAYLSLRLKARHFYVVDTSQTQEAALIEVYNLILNYASNQNGKVKSFMTARSHRPSSDSKNTEAL